MVHVNSKYQLHQQSIDPRILLAIELQRYQFTFILQINIGKFSFLTS